MTELDTQRLILRQWIDEDYKAFAKINADPDVMAYYVTILSEAESNELASKIQSLICKRGWGFWAVELKAENKFIGFVGLHKPEMTLPFTPCVEIGWRLNKSYWGKGYATEAASAALNFAFNTLMLDEVVTFTSVKNVQSQSLMQRLNMIDSGNNFEHPAIVQGHDLREHVLYKICRSHWLHYQNEH